MISEHTLTVLWNPHIFYGKWWTHMGGHVLHLPSTSIVNDLISWDMIKLVWQLCTSSTLISSDVTQVRPGSRRVLYRVPLCMSIACVCWNMTERPKEEIHFLSYLVCLIKRLLDRSIQCFPLGQSRHKFALTRRHTHTQIAALSASSNYWLSNEWKGRGMKIYHLCILPINYSKKQLMWSSVCIYFVWK